MDANAHNSQGSTDSCDSDFLRVPDPLASLVHTIVNGDGQGGTRNQLSSTSSANSPTPSYERGLFFKHSSTHSSVSAVTDYSEQLTDPFVTPTDAPGTVPPSVQSLSGFITGRGYSFSGYTSPISQSVRIFNNRADPH